MEDQYDPDKKHIFLIFGGIQPVKVGNDSKTTNTWVFMEDVWWQILKFDVEYLKELHKKHNKLPFLAEKIKIEKTDKLVPNL